MASLQDLTYTYEGSRTFAYDALNRLTSASGPFGAASGGIPTQTTETYGYDAIGNILEKAEPQRRPVRLANPQRRGRRCVESVGCYDTLWGPLWGHRFGTALGSHALGSGLAIRHPLCYPCPLARPLRLQFPGAVYHLTSHGNARQRIFHDEADRQIFLDTLAHVITRFGWRCHAYCLMDNHYHLLIETPKPNLSMGMRQLNGVYTQAFNRRHRRAGHLFQGRYTAILMEKQAHLLELCRYVVLNPLRVKVGTRVEQWTWSSYKATAGLAPVPEWLTVDWVLRQFGQDRAQAQAHYRNFVRAGLKNQPWQQLRGQIYLGSDEFIERLATTAERMREVPRAQWQTVKPPLKELLSKRGEQAIAVAYREYGYRLREIADYLHVHYATVSRKLRALETRGSRRA